MLDDLELSLMAFPQRWNGAAGSLDLNILLLPVGDPTVTFAGASISLIVNVAQGLDKLPESGTVPATTLHFKATPAPVAPTIFTTLRDQLVAKGITVTSGKLTTVPPSGARIQKSLPDSYRLAFPFEKTRTDDLHVGDGFGCALRAQAPGINAVLPKPDDHIAWGQVLSYMLRQPVLAADAGLIYRVPVPVSPAVLAKGGFVWVTLDAADPGNPYTAVGDTVRSYAARIPELGPKDTRSLFAATLAPVVNAAPGNLGPAQFEAEEYDDGFAQMVHSNQPATIDTATLAPDQIAPGAEAGIQIGWDDEQVTVWLNNQIDTLRDRVGGTTNFPEAPLGVLGYRVDVRLKGAASWSSLSVVNGTLPFTRNAFGGGASTSIDGQEFWVAPAPVRPSASDNSSNDQPGWLPLYFAQWAGSSLVLPDPVVQLLAYAVNAANTSKTGDPLPPPTLPNPNPDLTAVPVLRYGDEYEFRVRLVDLTGGGPFVSDDPVHPGTSPVTLLRFLRHVPPKSLEVVSSPAVIPFPAKPPAVRTIDTLAVRRPRINYPEALFAGVDPSTFTLANLGALIQDAWADGRAVGVPDPDVDRFEVRVEARIPAHDTGTPGTNPGDLDGVFRVVYSTEVPFPAGDDPTVTLTLNYVDGIDDISALDAPAPGSLTFPIPSSRDVRVRLFPQAATKPNYYGSDSTTVGLSSDYIVRSEAADEDRLFPNNPEKQLQAFYFQPGSNIAQLLGQQLGLAQDGLTLSGPPGIRTVFGASGAIRHGIAADAGSLTFASQTELLGHWIVALVVDLKRDWSWDGFGDPSLSFASGAGNIGVINVPRVVPAGATGVPGKGPDRSFSRIVFLDAVVPQPGTNGFPRELSLHYRATAQFTAAPAQTFAWDIRLPITTPPAQTLRIASTGIAESEYLHSPGYSETELRRRYLWVEFDRPIQDPDDAPFARVLAYGPDPLLAGSLLPEPFLDRMLPESVEPPLAIDPEPVRRIFSGQSADDSGLDSMQQMTPADPVGVGRSGTFFLLPLPRGIDPEELRLFGFWTYEFRVGHAQLWSTAQGRFGRPLRVTGIQHPPPHLICSTARDEKGVGATAAYAVTVDDAGNRFYDFEIGDPQTRIWFMLYTQVLQADGASRRNILLTHALGQTLIQNRRTRINPPNFQHGPGRDPHAAHLFPGDEIDALLARLGLPRASPLSVLAVELLPGPLRVRESPNKQALTPTEQELNEDPMGADLGLRRILRTSPLTAVPAIC